MATATSVITFDTNEWAYIDSFGDEHKVTNGQTFQMKIDDSGAADVMYWFAPMQTPITTVDGYKITLRPQTFSANSGNGPRRIGVLTDAGQGSVFYSLRGEISIECPKSGRVQHWTVAKMTPSDADYGAAGTITMTLEDQYGNVMVMPSPVVGGSITVGQAS